MDEWVNSLGLARIWSIFTTMFRGSLGSGAGYQLHFLAAAQNQAQSPLLNPSSRWYNPLNNNDKPAQEHEES
jgi:hypothetical protein